MFLFSTIAEFSYTLCIRFNIEPVFLSPNFSRYRCDTFKETYANRIRDSFAEGEVSFKIFTITIHRTSICINAAKNIYLSKTLISRRDNHGWMDTRGALSRMRNYRRKGLDRDSAVSAIIVRPFGINF